MTYKKINNLSGWFVWLIATVVYIMTLEPTVSFWDCGEFISAAYKLQVVHPPGAPFFLLLGRIFTMFAGSQENVAWTVNLMSGLCSSFSILFLFWSITHFGRKITGKIRKELSTPETIIVMLSGAVGALCYTFSDSFWFSAVEGEVYAMSSFFTAIVFWAALKWEDNADKAHSNRWLLLIAYLMGLSIGVHLLNLLCIPAICFVYYFRKTDKVSRRGLITTMLVSILILGFIQWGIIPGIPSLATKFELLFVNGFGLGFGTGAAFFILLLSALIAFGIWYTQKQGDKLVDLKLFKAPAVQLNTFMLALAFIIIGYSTYTMTVIRSNSNTSIDMNDPEDAFALLSYINREQYGERPLVRGPVFTAEVVDQEDGKMKYRKGEEKYDEIGRDVIPIYEPSKVTLFPRMYKAGNITANHTSFYKNWENLKDGEDPSFMDNLSFMVSYQFGHMWFRYFMWNFSGRQNDTQGQGIGQDQYDRGNWISGIKALDEARLGEMDNLPYNRSANRGNNRYFMLPFLFGLIGAFFHYKKHPRDFMVVAMLFFLTGVAINIYLNMPPLQPRERDYAYVGSFYAYAIWVGLGVQAIWTWISKKSPNAIMAIAVGLVGLVAVPGLMASENWDDHDRSGKYTARDFGTNYLESCSPGGILFSMGDNDTYPLWYAQEVERVRTDTRVINLSLLGTDWYINQMRSYLGVGPGVKFSLPPEKIVTGLRDYVPFVDNPAALYAEKFEANFSELSVEYAPIFAEFINLLQASNFPNLNAADFKTIADAGLRFAPNRLVNLMSKLNTPASRDRYGLPEAATKSVIEKASEMNQKVAAAAAPLKAVMEFIASDDASTRVPLQSGEMIDYLPTRKFLIPVDREKVISNGMVSPKLANRVQDKLIWDYPRTNILKNDLMILDLIATNDWDKPIYFTISMGPESYIGLQKFFQLEGLTYKLVPIENNNSDLGLYGVVETDTMYNNMINKFKYGKMEDPHTYIDPETNRMTLNLRSNFVRLAEELLREGDKERAKIVLDKCQEVMPLDKVVYNIINFHMITPYYGAGAYDEANELSSYLFDRFEEEANYFQGMDSKKQKIYERDLGNAMAVMQELHRLAVVNNQGELAEKYMPRLQALGIGPSPSLQQDPQQLLQGQSPQVVPPQE